MKFGALLEADITSLGVGHVPFLHARLAEDRTL